MKLVLPSEKYYQSYLAYIQELGDEERFPFTLDLPFKDCKELLTRLDAFSLGKSLPEGSVANTTLWLVEGDEITGITNVRHYLNARIEHCGGHIGLGIRPSFRGKGLGNTLMQLSIEYLLKLGVNPIHIHCYKDNTSSAKTILNNGGLLASEFADNQRVIQRYLVTCKN